MSLSKTTETAYQQQQSGFQPATSLQTESLPATSLLYAAYGTVWVVLILYVFFIATRLTKVERELKDVSARLAKRS